MVNIAIASLLFSSFFSNHALARRNSRKHYSAGRAGLRGGSPVCGMEPSTAEPLASTSILPVASVVQHNAAPARPILVSPSLSQVSLQSSVISPQSDIVLPNKASSVPSKVMATESRAAIVSTNGANSLVASGLASLRPSAVRSPIAKAVASTSGVVSAAAPSISSNTSSLKANFVDNPAVGGGGSEFLDSAHFRVYAASSAPRDASLKLLETAYSCFVDDLGWRSPGVSFNNPPDSPGPYYKLNVYGRDTLGGAAGQQGTDSRAGFAFLNVVNTYLANAGVIVHELGHALTYHERNWVYQKRTGAWWETVAQFFADTVITSPICAAARARNNQEEGSTLIDLGKVIGDSHQVIVDGSGGSGNYYQAWPFLVYITNNPDSFANLGQSTVREMFRQYKINSDETPLHVLERVLGGKTKVQQVVGRYWARMAFVDIGHAQAATRFRDGRKAINYANLNGGNGQYTAKADRAPRYMGASIVPLNVAANGGQVIAKVAAPSPFSATLVVRDAAGNTKYVDFSNGSASATLMAGEEAAVVIANTPDELIMYDGFALAGTDANKGLAYQLQLEGATA